MVGSEEVIALGNLLEAQAVEWKDEPFMLSHGAPSNWYVDVRKVMMTHEGARLAGQVMVAGAETLGLEYNSLMAMGLGGRAVMFTMQIANPNLYTIEVNPDNDPKDRYPYGLLGAPVTEATRILEIDDTGTTGGSLVKMLDIAKEFGAEVSQVLNLVDRSQGAVSERLTKLSVTYHFLYEFDETDGSIKPQF